MEKLIDLSHLITNKMPVYPGDEGTILDQTKYLNRDKYNNHSIRIGLHTGTHIDSPMHLTEKTEYISQLPLSAFIGRGCLLDVRNEPIIKMKKKYEDLIIENSIVLLYTGFDSMYGTSKYFKDHPIVDASLADYFIEKKIKILGMDTPSPDKYPFIIHKRFFTKDILIMENLCNLANLIGVHKFEIIAFPLKIAADSSILRVVARVL